MNWSDIGDYALKSAPLLGAVLGGPAGAAVGSIGAAVASAFGGNHEDLDDLSKRILSDPEAELKFAKIQSDHLIELQRLSVNQANNYLLDKQSARGREVDMAKSGNRDWTPIVISIIFVVGYFLLMTTNLWDKQAFNDIESARVQDALMLILSYYFGSSAKSEK